MIVPAVVGVPPQNMDSFLPAAPPYVTAIQAGIGDGGFVVQTKLVEPGVIPFVI